MTLPARAPSDDSGLAADLVRHAARLDERLGSAGGGGTRLFFSPGRVNLMGAHLDYNGGPVMPMAVDRGTFFAIRPRADRLVRFASTCEDGGLECDLDAALPPASATWTDYPLGVVRALLADRGAPCGVDVLFGGNLAVGAGLSSSASICVGTALALDAVWGLGTSAMERIRAALWAEREFVGVQCGIMDPYAVGLSRPGHLLWLDCKDESTEHLPLDTDTLSIAVVDTGVRRELAQGAFNERVAECARAFEGLRPFAPGAQCLRDVPLAVLEEHGDVLDDASAERARHVLMEVARTFAARESLLAGDPACFGAQMSKAHWSLRDLFRVSVPELDALVELSLEVPGVLGTRLTGAGFGGCTVVLLKREARDELAARLREGYRDRFGREASIGFFDGDAGPREIAS